MLKEVKKLAVLMLVICMALSATTAFAEVGETLLFSDEFSSLPNWSGSSVGTVGFENVQPFKTASQGQSSLFLKDGSYKNLNLSFSFTAESWSTDENAAFTAYVRYIDENNYYKFTYRPYDKNVSLQKKKDGIEEFLYNMPRNKEMNITTDVFTNPGTYNVSIVVANGVVRAEVNDTVLLQGIDNNEVTGNGTVGFSTDAQEILFESIAVKTPKVLIHEDFENGILLGQITKASGAEVTTDNGKVTLCSNATGISSYLLKGATLEQDELFANATLWVNANVNSNMKNGYMNMRTRLQNDDKCYATFQHGAQKADGSFQPYSTISREGVAQVFQRNISALFQYDTDVDYYYYTKNYSLEDGGNEVVFTVGKDKMYTEYGSYWKYEDATENAIFNGGGYCLQTISGTVAINDIKLESTEPEQILFTADFEKATEWTLVNLCETQVTDNKVYKTNAAQNGIYILGDNEWTNTETSIDVKTNEWSTDDSSFVALYSRYFDENNYARFMYYPKSQYEGNAKYVLQIVENGTSTAEKIDYRPTIGAGEFHKLTLGVKDGNIRGAIDEKYVIETYAFNSVANTAKPYGSVAVQTNNQAAIFDNVKVTGSNKFIYDNFDGGNPWYSISSSGVMSGIKFSNAVNDNGVLKNSGNKLIFELYSNNKMDKNEESILYTSIKSDTWDELNIKRRCVQTLADRTEAYDLRISYNSLIFMYDSKWSFGNAASVIGSYNCTDALTDGSSHVIGYGIIDKENSVVLKAYIDGNLVLECETQKIPEAFKTAENEAMYNDFNAVHPIMGSDNERIYFDLYKEVEVDWISLEDTTVDEKLHSAISFDDTVAAAGKTVQATYSIDNNKYIPEDASIILAVYDENMKLSSLSTVPVKLHSQVDNTFTQSVTLPAEANENWSVYAMAWKNMSDIVPIGAKATISK